MSRRGDGGAWCHPPICPRHRSDQSSRAAPITYLRNSSSSVRSGSAVTPVTGCDRTSDASSLGMIWSKAAATLSSRSTLGTERPRPGTGISRSAEPERREPRRWSFFARGPPCVDRMLLLGGSRRLSALPCGPLLHGPRGLGHRVPELPVRRRAAILLHRHPSLPQPPGAAARLRAYRAVATHARRRWGDRRPPHKPAHKSPSAVAAFSPTHRTWSCRSCKPGCGANLGPALAGAVHPSCEVARRQAATKAAGAKRGRALDNAAA